MSERLFPAPADPATLTDRQALALDIVDIHGQVTPTQLGCLMGYQPGWWHDSGIQVLRELHNKGLVKRVGKGGGRWTLSGEDARTGSHKGTAAPSSPPSQTDTIPY